MAQAEANSLHNTMKLLCLFSCLQNRCVQGGTAQGQGQAWMILAFCLGTQAWLP